MKQSFERKWIVTALGLTLLLMGINNFISYRNAKKLFESAERVKHTNEVLKSITDISTTLIDAESSERINLLFIG